MIGSVGVMGYGAFGEVAEGLVARFAKHVSVKVWGRVADVTSKNFAPLEEVAKCDVLILAVPIRNYDEALEMVRPHLRADTILVDIATVKGYTTQLFSEMVSVQPRLHLHPMFGPASLKRAKGSVKDLPIVVTGKTIPMQQYRALKKFAQRCGFRIIEMTADEHDKKLAETLFIAHLLAQTLRRSDFLKKTPFDTPSVRLMKEAAELIANDTELFRDVVHFNRHCRDAMVQWMKAQSFIWELLADAK